MSCHRFADDSVTMALIDKTVGRGGSESNIPFILYYVFDWCAYLCHSVVQYKFDL